jgi:hypothetical protein
VRRARDGRARRDWRVTRAGHASVADGKSSAGRSRRCGRHRLSFWG